MERPGLTKYFTVLLFLITGLIVSWKFYQVRYHFETNKITSQFHQAAEERALAIKERIATNIGVLDSVHALFDTDGVVSRKKFQTFVAPFIKQYKSIQGLAWVPRVQHSEREAYRTAAQKQFPNFQITHEKEAGVKVKASKQDEYLPVYYVELYRGNEKELGADLSAMPNFSKTLGKSRDMNTSLIMTRPIQVHGEKAYELLVYRPVYRRGALLKTVKERRDNFLGFILGMYDVDTMITSVLRHNVYKEPFNINLLDLSGRKGDQVLFAYRGRLGAPVKDKQSKEKLTLFYDTHFTLAGKSFALQFTPAGKLYSAEFARSSWLDFALGLIITFLLSIYVLSVLGRSEKTMRLARELQETKEYTENIIQSMSNMLIVFDRDWMIGTVNLATLKKLGYKQEALLGKPIDTLLENDNAEINAKVKALLHQDPHGSLEVDLMKSDGSVLSGLLFMSPMYADKHKIQAIVCLVEDLSERKLLEEEKDSVQNQLFQSQKLESIGQLAGGIAHDFNNIMNIILGEVMLLKKQDKTLDAVVVDRLKIIETSAGRATELTQKLLGFARKGQYEKKYLSMNALVEETQTILSSTIEKSINVALKLDTDLWMIAGDGSQLSQVLMNLCLNARDAMPAGGELTITTQNLNADKLYCTQHPQLTQGRYVMLSVADTGVGIDKLNLEKIYEPFFTTKPVTEGTGLGLSLVYGIIKNHHGFLSVYSESNEGTTFQFFLPAVEDKRNVDRESESSQAIQTEQLHGKRVLVVDDETFLVDILTEMLVSYDMKVTGMADSQQALEFVTTKLSEVDVVLLDVVMPKINGYDLFAVIRKVDAKKPVIFMSGYAESDKIRECREQGLVGFLQKPYVEKSLLAALNSVLSLR
jgi:PAS domain S-box-containing protein